MNFSSLDNIDPFLRIAWDKYCIDGAQCRCATCPMNALMVNMSFHIDAKNKFLIFGDVIMIEKLGTYESKDIPRKNR